MTCGPRRTVAPTQQMSYIKSIRLLFRSTIIHILPTPMRKYLSLTLCLSLLASCTPATDDGQSQSSENGPSGDVVVAEEYKPFGSSVSYKKPNVTIDPAVAQDFQTSIITTLPAFEKEHGFTLSEVQKKFLADNKFIVLPPGSITDLGTSDIDHEFYALYQKINGSNSYKERTQANALFFTSDVFMFAFARLYEETLKEMENKVFFPAMKTLSEKFFQQADAKAKTATGLEKTKWMKVRNYVAVPYALLSTAKQPLMRDDYLNGGGDPEALKAASAADDKTADTIEKATAFVQSLLIDDASKNVIIADLQTVFKAEGKGQPKIFEAEFKEYKELTDIDFFVDFTQFTPRSHYTSSSLRRQYFRAMNWFIQLPFFIKSPALTEYAFGLTQLMSENPQQLNDYNKLEAAINFMVGSSDDLMPVDYMSALHAAKGSADKEKAIMEYLIKARPPRIKSLSASYPTAGDVQSDDVTLLTKGMRFFSGKFIIDSYWTDMLTQGDEAVLPGFTQKLPPMASSLEVMTLLGSDYAKSKIPTLDFYKPETKEAIDQMMMQLVEENAMLDASYWQNSIYNSWLWTIQGLFSWQKTNKTQLPTFMQSPMWDIKTLMTGAAFWTHGRHATLLYAKQSFAELGGGGDACDPRQIPPPAKSYIEPQPEVYARLQYMAKKMKQGLEDQKFELDNLYKLDLYVTLMDKVQKYSNGQLGNMELKETVKKEERPDPEDPSKKCTEYWIDGESPWEDLRMTLVGEIGSVIPTPAEGPIMSAKDKRAAISADVHTGGDSTNPTKILYEGIGVPMPIIVAVKDINGARFTIGFMYSHYEQAENYGGQRRTDEDWQKNFYVGEDGYDPYNYTNRAAWPTFNSWYLPFAPVR